MTYPILLLVLLNTIKFLLFLFIACLGPGLVLTDKNEPFFKRMFLSLVVGLVLFTATFYIFSLLNLRFLIFVYVLFFLYIILKQKLFNLLKVNIRQFLNKINWAAIHLIAAGVIFQMIPTFRSGLTFSYGLGFWGPNSHDGIWHVSLINQLVKGLPPDNPILAGEALKNYHFFYDLMVASTAFVTGIPVMDLVFRFYPAIFSLLLGIGTYFFTSSLFKNKLAAILSLYFVYFAGSFGWIVDYLKSRSLGGESAFWANQSISFNLNPPFAISLCIVIAIMLVLINIKEQKFTHFFILTIFSGTLISFKAYGAILILVSLLLTGLLKRNLQYLFVFITSLMLAVPLFFSTFSADKQLMIFSPFWLIHSMIDSADRVGWTRISLIRVTGLQNNWLKFITAETISLFVFLIGNLGMRFLAIFSIIRIKQIFNNTYHLFLFIFCLTSFIIPIVFIQAGNPWNIIQFSYYGLYIAAVCSAIVLVHLFSKLRGVFSIFLLVSVLALTPINSITTASYYLGDKPHALIENEELEALDFLSKQEDGIVLTYPYDKKLQLKVKEPWPLSIYDSTAYVSALSGKRVFIEDEIQNQILLTDYKSRLDISKDFFSNPISEKIKFLSNNDIEYIYLPKLIYSINEPLDGIKIIFENNKVVVFKVK